MRARVSESLPECSYRPGLESKRVDQILPQFISKRLKLAFKEFEKTMPGFIHEKALVVAPESRTSSPIRIPRDKETMENNDLKGLYPCGEGAGYAGGIVSAAIDGKKVAEKIAETILE